MPMYDYKCNKCGTKWEEHLPVAKRDFVMCHCGEVATRLLSAPTVAIFKPYVHTNLGPENVLIESRKQEKYEFDSRGVHDAR